MVFTTILGFNFKIYRLRSVRILHSKAIHKPNSRVCSIVDLGLRYSGHIELQFWEGTSTTWESEAGLQPRHQLDDIWNKVWFLMLHGGRGGFALLA